MNWHRYKASISLQNPGTHKYEFVGTWIGFAGMLTLIAHISLGVNSKEVFLTSTIVISALFLLHWVAQKSLRFTGIYAVSLMCWSLGSIQRATILYPQCSELVRESFQLNCQRDVITTGIYAAYLLSIFGAYFFYITRKFWKDE